MVKLIPLAGLMAVVIGCGASTDSNSFVNAPEIKQTMSSEASMQRRGMTAEEMAVERNAQAASMPGGTR